MILSFHIKEFMELYIHEPFAMMVAGLIFWFLLGWSRGRNKGKWKKVGFWHDQKDEMAVSFVGGLIFIVWDQQVLNVIAFFLKKATLMNESTVLSMQVYYYFLVGPIIEKIYDWTYGRKQHEA